MITVFTTALSALLALILGAAPARAQTNPGAHQHGTAKLDLVFEAGSLSLDLDAPLDSLLGFERVPRTATERAAAEAALARLRDAAALIRIDPAARCAAAAVTIQSTALLPVKGAAKPLQAASEHADVEVAYRFKCEGTAPAWVDLGLFEAFARLQRIEVQLSTAKGQRKQMLLRPAKRVALAH